MLYLLDTNVVSELSKPVPDARVLRWLQTVEVPRLSVITVGELSIGLHLLPLGRRRTELETRTSAFLSQPKIRVLPVTAEIALRWGELIALRQRMGHPLSAADGLIAATALEHDLTLVTRNTRDFEDLGLRLLNLWQQ